MKKTYVYLIESSSGHFKIGYSSDPERRLAELQKTVGPYECTLLLKIPFETEDKARDFELLSHEEHREQRVRGEWFTMTAQDLVTWGAVSELYHRNYELAQRTPY